MKPLDRFTQIWAVDFEFSTGSDLNPDPLCMVAIELRSEQTIRMWREELRSCSRAPFDTGPNSVMVAYSARS
jgi:DNA polymerase-1